MRFYFYLVLLIMFLLSCNKETTTEIPATDLNLPAGTSQIIPTPQIYDTTLPGYSNTGHFYGDSLSEEDRSDLIEYLKSL